MSIQKVNGVNPKSRIIVTEEGVYKKASTAQNIAAFTAANIVGSKIQRPILNMARKPIKADLNYYERVFSSTELNPMMQKLFGVSEEHLKNAKEIKKAVDTVFKESDLSKYGVKLVDVKELSDVKIGIPKYMEKVPLIGDMLKKKVEMIKKNIVEGKNAAFGPKTGKIYVNKEKMPYAAFHEMGHAYNKHVSKVGKIMAKLRTPGMMLASVAMLAALLKRKKADGEQPNGVFDRVTTYIKDHCAGLALAGTLPTVIEEGMASINGAKLARKANLSEQSLKLVNRFHGKAWLTYAGYALATTAATWIASKVKDAIAGPKKIDK